MDMEFSKGTPATQQDIALADAPRVNIQPAHSNIHLSTSTHPNIETVSNFAFDSESTSETATRQTTEHPHHSTAVVFACITAIVFAAVLLFLYVLR